MRFYVRSSDPLLTFSGLNGNPTSKPSKTPRQTKGLQSGDVQRSRPFLVTDVACSLLGWSEPTHQPGFLVSLFRRPPNLVAFLLGFPFKPPTKATYLPALPPKKKGQRRELEAQHQAPGKLSGSPVSSLELRKYNDAASSANLAEWMDGPPTRIGVCVSFTQTKQTLKLPVFYPKHPKRNTQNMCFPWFIQSNNNKRVQVGVQKKHTFFAHLKTGAGRGLKKRSGRRVQSWLHLTPTPHRRKNI